MELDESVQVQRTQQTGRTSILLIVDIGALALTLRLLAVGYGLPHIYSTDEGFEVHRALKLGAGAFEFHRVSKGGFSTSFWNWPSIDPAHMVTHTSPTTWGETNPPSPALTFGDAPWQPGRELCSCTLRGIQICSSLLSLADIQNEIVVPKSTEAGSASIWYLNLNPTPTDITDKSGLGNDPEWVGSERPILWSE